MIGFFIYLTISIFLLISFVFIKTLFHELGHSFIASRYKLTAAEIMVFSPWKFSLKTKNTKFYFKNLKTIQKGGYEPDNNFQVYSNEEIKKIAMAGPIFAWFYSFVCVLLLLSYSFYIFLVYENFLMCLIGMAVIFGIIYITIHSHFMLVNRKFDKKWIDYEIYKDPSGFKEYRNELEINGKLPNFKEMFQQ